MYKEYMVQERYALTLFDELTNWRDSALFPVASEEHAKLFRKSVQRSLEQRYPEAYKLETRVIARDVSGWEVCEDDS